VTAIPVQVRVIILVGLYCSDFHAHISHIIVPIQFCTAHFGVYTDLSAIIVHHSMLIELPLLLNT
jgi:hypothetical protein